MYVGLNHLHHLELDYAYINIAYAYKSYNLSYHIIYILSLTLRLCIEYKNTKCEFCIVLVSISGLSTRRTPNFYFHFHTHPFTRRAHDGVGNTNIAYTPACAPQRVLRGNT